MSKHGQHIAALFLLSHRDQAPEHWDRGKRYRIDTVDYEQYFFKTRKEATAFRVKHNMVFVTVDEIHRARQAMGLPLPDENGIVERPVRPHDDYWYQDADNLPPDGGHDDPDDDDDDDDLPPCNPEDMDITPLADNDEDDDVMLD